MLTTDQEHRVHLLTRRLRSGKHPQVTGSLCEKRGSEWGYCCLGIACIVYQEEGPGDLRIREEEDFKSFNDELSSLPIKVAKWYGFRTIDGDTQEKIEGQSSLVALNDTARWSFEKIADAIDSKPKGLFK